MKYLSSFTPQTKNKCDDRRRFNMSGMACYVYFFKNEILFRSKSKLFFFALICHKITQHKAEEFTFIKILLNKINEVLFETRF